MGNNANSSIQVFDAVGNFLYGLRLPSFGGSFWMCKSDARLFIYIVRTNQVFELLGQECVQTKTIEYSDPETFYKDCNYDSGDKQVTISLFMRNLTIEDGNTKKVIELAVPILPLSIGIGFLMLAIGFLGLFIINGYFDRFLDDDNSLNNNDVVQFFKNYGNKLK